MMGNELVWTKTFGGLSVLPNSTHLSLSMDFSLGEKKKKKAGSWVQFSILPIHTPKNNV